jgi:hypothetical protein
MEEAEWVSASVVSVQAARRISTASRASPGIDVSCCCATPVGATGGTRCSAAEIVGNVTQGGDSARGTRRILPWAMFFGPCGAESGESGKGENGGRKWGTPAVLYRAVWPKTLVRDALARSQTAV